MATLHCQSLPWNHLWQQQWLPSLATSGDTTQIDPILFVSCHQRWQRWTKLTLENFGSFALPKFAMKPLVTAAVTTFLGHLRQLNTNRSNPICVMSPEVTKVNKTYLGELWLFYIGKICNETSCGSRSDYLPWPPVEWHLRKATFARTKFVRSPFPPLSPFPPHLA